MWLHLVSWNQSLTQDKEMNPICSKLLDLTNNIGAERKAQSYEAAYRRCWRCPASRAHQSQSVCLLRCRRQGNRRGQGNPPLRQTESCHHGNQRQRRSWCPPPYHRFWSPSTAPPEQDNRGAERVQLMSLWCGLFRRDSSVQRHVTRTM